MFNFANNFRLVIALAAAALGADCAAAAGLVGYRNDTNLAIVVQSTVVSNSKTTLSKPQTLYPGEVALDGLAFVGTRRITIYDAKNTKIVLFQGDVTNSDDAFYTIQVKATTLPIKGSPAPKGQAPQLELVKVQLPAMPRPGRPMPPGQPTPPPKKQ